MTLTPRVLVASLLLLAGPAVALADLDAEARIGFSGRWVAESATPLVVTLRNTGSEPVRVRIRIGSNEMTAMGGGGIVHLRELEVPVGVTREEAFLVAGPMWMGAQEVRLDVSPKVPIHAATGRGDKEKLTGDRGQLTFPVGQRQMSDDQVLYSANVLGVVGDARGMIAGRVLKALGQDTSRFRPGARFEIVDVSPHLLRLAPLGLEGLNTLLICDPEAQFAAEPGESDALLDWVALGGRLVVSLGEHSAAFNGSPLAAEMPGTWTGADRAPYSELLRLQSPSPVTGPWSELHKKGGDPPAEGDPAPPVLERPLGLGKIVLLAYDLRVAFAGMPTPVPRDVAAQLLAEVTPLPSREDEQSYNVLDLSGLFARTLQTGAFEPPPLPLVVLGILCYVVVVGPIDWFVLKRLRKERLTTLTFSGAVAAFTFLAYGASLLLFSSGSRVNRIVFADLVDAGREGRQLLKLHDLAAYYSPAGVDREVNYVSAAAILPGSLPGLPTGGDVGTALPVEVTSTDALHPKVNVQLAFRSQRVVRAQAVTTTGPSIDVEWTGEGDERGVRVTNGLPIALERVDVYTGPAKAYQLGGLAAGEKSNNGEFESRARDVDLASVANLDVNRAFGGSRGAPSEDEIRTVLTALSVNGWGAADPRQQFVGRVPGAAVVRGQPQRGVVVNPMWNQSVTGPRGEKAAALRKAGIDRSEAFARKHALVVAFARKAQVRLPGDDTDGDTYVVIRKEVPLP